MDESYGEAFVPREDIAAHRPKVLGGGAFNDVARADILPRMRIHRSAVLAVFVALLVLFARPVPARAAPPLGWENRDFDQIHLEVHVAPHLTEGTVDGTVGVEFASLADPLTTLRLHCDETDVMGVTDADKAPLVFRLEEKVLSITLGKPLPRGEKTTVWVRYRSHPTSGLYFHCPSGTCPDTPLEMYSQGEGTDNRKWIPCYDEPDDRTTCDVYATVPAALKTVSNGVLVKSLPLDGELREDHWKLEQRIPTYLISLIVGKFETVTDNWKDVPLEYNGPVGRAEEIKTGFAATPAIMDFFSEYTGRHFPYPRYAQTTVWDFVYGGMENAGATTMNMRLLHLPDVKPNYSPDNLVAHEMAHQWFGDLMTCRTWDHIWLNEGFATYFADLFFEHRDGPEKFALDRFNQNRGYMKNVPHPESLNLKPSPRGDIPLELDGGKQYDRGAAILNQLRIELGDDVFREGIRRYIRENEDKPVVSEDLRHSMEAAAGQDLKWFFDQWVYGAGYPVLNVSWAIPPKSLNTIHVVVDQAQAAGSGQPEAFRISVPYRFGAGDGPIHKSGADETALLQGRFDIRRRHQEFDLEFSGAIPQFLRVGDGGGTFAKANVTQGREAWASELAIDTDPTGRVEAAEALPAWPEAAIADLAKALAKDPSYAVRSAAADSLGQIAGQGSLDALMDGLADKDARVRESIVNALGDRNRRDVGTIVAGLAKSDANPYVRAAAAKAVGKVHPDGAFETLTGLLSVDSHREAIRAGAIEGLKSLGDVRAIEAVKPLLAYNWRRGDHHRMRQMAMELILTLAPDEPSSHAIVVGLLDDPFNRMRSWAAEACGKYMIHSAEARLKKMADSDPDGGPKGAAKAALEKLAVPPKK